MPRGRRRLNAAKYTNLAELIEASDPDENSPERYAKFIKRVSARLLPA